MSTHEHIHGDRHVEEWGALSVSEEGDGGARGIVSPHHPHVGWKSLGQQWKIQ